MRAHARTATPEEKPELWSVLTKEWPDYDRYQENTDRDIPVVVLEPRQGRYMSPNERSAPRKRALLLWASSGVSARA